MSAALPYDAMWRKSYGGGGPGSKRRVLAGPSAASHRCDARKTGSLTNNLDAENIRQTELCCGAATGAAPARRELFRRVTIAWAGLPKLAFFLKAADAQVEFVAGDDGEIEAPILHQGGESIRAPRL